MKADENTDNLATRASIKTLYRHSVRRWCFSDLPLPRKPRSLVLLAIACVIPIMATAAPHQDDTFNCGWRFHRGDRSGAQDPGFNDAGWRSVDLPHDWSIEPNGDAKFRDPETPEGKAVGYLRGGTGWYSKHFPVGPAEAGRDATIVFDGVQQDCDVWLNGHYLGFQPHGYVAFTYELGPWLNRGGDNVVAVRVINPEANTRWYAGSGIYRLVGLHWHDPLHITEWGTRIDTAWVNGSKALLQVAVEVRNDRDLPQDFSVEATLTAPGGTPETRPIGRIQVAPQSSERLNAGLELDAVRLWSPESPSLYQAQFRIVQQGKTVDIHDQTFGIRTIAVDSQNGLLLNGNPVKLRGACLHHDNGLIGAAAFPDAEARRVRLMRANGFNAIRTSHNPPSSAFLEACDEQGVLVLDEFVDSWQLPKRPNGYTRYFDRHWQHDLDSMIARDFNHPSVILWSIGNEIAERYQKTGLVTGRMLAEFVRGRDPRRPVTNAINGIYEETGALKGQWDPNAPAFEFLDVGGYNYEFERYESDHARYSKRVMVGTESFPKETFENWRAIAADPWVIGDFVWTGMDHLGESGIGHTGYIPAGTDPQQVSPLPWDVMPYPCWINWCGDIDIVGNKKPQSYFRDVVWGRSPVELAVHEPVPPGQVENVGLWGWPAERQSWTWSVAPGTPLEVKVYSAARAVRLELNGRVVGEATIDANKGITATFNVPYEPGVLRAFAIPDGKVTGSTELATAGSPAAARVSPEGTTLRPDRLALAYLPIEIVDAAGRVVPDAALPISVKVDGPADLIALGSANPEYTGLLNVPQSETFRGRALAILRSTGAPGPVRVRIQAGSLPEVAVSLQPPAP